MKKSQKQRIGLKGCELINHCPLINDIKKAPLEYILLFSVFVCLIVYCYMSTIVSYLLAFLLLLFSWYLTKLQKKPFRLFATLSIPLFIMFADGALISSFNLVSSARNVLRDFFYFSEPILFLTLGFSLSPLIPRRKFDTAIIAYGISFSLINLFRLVAYKGDNVLSFSRSVFLPGIEIIVLSIYLLLFSLKEKFLWRRLFLLLFLATIFISSLSRTNLILMAACLTYFLLKTFPPQKAIIIGAGLIIICAISAFLLYRANVSGAIFIIDKLSRASLEISPLSDWSSSWNRTYFWRGYENYCGLLVYQNSDFFSQLVGHGFGSTIALVYPQAVGGSTIYFELPILHDQYLTILTKTGLLGIFSFACAVIAFLKQSQKIKNIESRGICFAIGIFIIFASFVIMNAFTSLLCVAGFYLFAPSDLQNI